MKEKKERLKRRIAKIQIELEWLFTYKELFLKTRTTDEWQEKIDLNLERLQAHIDKLKSL